MSLTKPSLAGAVKKQFNFKLKSFVGVFSGLIILQLLALLFSLGGTASMSRGGTAYDFQVRYFGADIVVVFTMLWAFINAILIKTKAYTEDDFLFVTNRLSSNLSNIAFLVAACIVGGVTAILSGYLLKDVIYFLFDTSPIMQTGMANVPDLVIGILATILFVFTCSSAGYLVGTLVQLHKSMAYIIPVVVIGLIMVVAQQTGVHMVVEVGQFYFAESSFWILVCKTVATSAVLFGASILISNRLEVKK
ncbi:hypothetical protein [Virgibacillus doumboii]|uniref:hypothetical protein n=1 Tax=Virgibacillus doumboii TaxID=2697503 RepID=UPI0013E0BC05|nr:hypothetical protein [Virgibacillus doumboii]